MKLTKRDVLSVLIAMIVLISIVVCIMFLVFAVYIMDAILSFHTADLDFLYDVELSEIEVDYSKAYYLSTDGTLYCAGADSDAGSYVVYQDKKQGIVAENVASFGIMSYGGYYIDRNNNLYIYNENNISFYGYKRDRHKLIMENVISAQVSPERIMYIDTNHDLYYASSEHAYRCFGGKNPNSLERPLKIASGVSRIIYESSNSEFLVYLDLEGKIQIFGVTDKEELSYVSDLIYLEDMLYFKEQFQDFEIQEISSFGKRNRLVLLKNGELWFYGDYQRFIEGSDEKKSEKELHLLCENVCAISNSYDAFGALDAENRFFVWGKCWENDGENSDKTNRLYVEKRLISDQAKDIHLDAGAIGYVDIDGASHIYCSGGYDGFYGNSTKDRYVGLNRDPVTWVEKKK